jgi:hypothetical protein
MRRLLAQHFGKLDQIFDADDMQILVGAFDKAWEAVQASGVIYPKDKVELVRAILAKHIIAAAKDGERDHSRLRDGALLALARSNLEAEACRVRSVTPASVARVLSSSSPLRRSGWKTHQSWSLAAKKGASSRIVGFLQPRPAARSTISRSSRWARRPACRRHAAFLLIGFARQISSRCSPKLCHANTAHSAGGCSGGAPSPLPAPLPSAQSA